MQNDKDLNLKGKNMPILSFAIDKVHEAVFLINKNGKFDYVNEEACRMLGYDLNELSSLNVMKINPNMNELTWSNHWINLREQKTVIFLSEMKTKTGSLISVEISANYFIYQEEEYDLGIVRDLTERKINEVKLQKSEEQYRRIIETASEGIFIVQPNSYVSFANDRIIDILGYTKEELYSHPLTDYLVPDEIQNHYNRIEKRRKRISETYESRFIKKNGQIIWTRISATPILDDAGNYTSSLAMISDITENKKAEIELFKLNRIYKMLTQCNEALIHATDEKNLLETICNLMVDVGNYKMVWVGFAQNDEEKFIKPIVSAGEDLNYLNEIKVSWGDGILGTGPGGKAIRSKKIQVVNNKKELDLSRVKAWVEGIKSHNISSCVVLPLIENNEAFGILTLYSELENIFDKKEMALLKDLANNISYGISGLRIKAREKQAEQDRIAYVKFIESLDIINKAMQSSSDINQVLNNVLDKIIEIFDCDRTYLLFPGDFTASTWQILNLRHKPAYPSITILQKEYPMDQDISYMIQKTLESELPVNFAPDTNNNFSIQVSTKFGYKSLLAMAIYPKMGKPWVFVITQCSHVRNWTIDEVKLVGEIGRRLEDWLNTLLIYQDLQKSEERLQLLNQNLEKRVADRTNQLEKLNKELEAFSYRVSHDLRVPLGHIQSYVTLLQNNLGKQSKPENSVYVSKIVDSTKLMDHLIEDILTLSKLDYQELTLTAVNLNELVNTVIHYFQPDIINRKIKWNITNLPLIHADKSLIRLVFVNLLSNALKFTKKQEDTIITIGSLTSNEENTIFVKDNGVGFDMQYNYKLFTAFQRLHSDIEFEGTGIGLSNVQRIIKSHGGKIWAESEPNKGATFYFSIPIKKL